MERQTTVVIGGLNGTHFLLKGQDLKSGDEQDRLNILKDIEQELATFGEIKEDVQEMPEQTKVLKIFDYLERKRRLEKFGIQLGYNSEALRKLFSSMGEQVLSKEEVNRQRKLILEQLKLFVENNMAWKKDPGEITGGSKTPRTTSDKNSSIFQGTGDAIQLYQILQKRYVLEEEDQQAIFRMNNGVTKIYGYFNVNGVTVTRVLDSLLCFDDKNRLRIVLVKIVESDWFNNFILFAIIGNSITIAAYDHSQSHIQRNNILDWFTFLFTAIYTIEAISKIIANGFLMGKNTYMREPTNVFDFIIVVSSLSEIVTRKYVARFRFLAKYFRILRALRVLKLFSIFQKMPQMRQQIRTLVRISALKRLLSVLFFLSLFYMFFVIMGLQLFSDEIFNACRITSTPVEGVNGKLIWERAPTEGLSPGGICTKTKSWYAPGGFICPKPYTCGSFLDYKMPVEEDGVQFNSQLFYNVAIFSDFGSSALATFQIFIADSWGNHLYNMINSSDFLLPILFCFVIHMLGTYYLLNLLCATMMESYIESAEFFAKDEILEKEKEITAVEACLSGSNFFNNYLMLKQAIQYGNLTEQLKEPGSKSLMEPETPAFKYKSDKSFDKQASSNKKQASLMEPEIEDKLEAESQKFMAQEYPDSQEGGSPKKQLSKQIQNKYLALHDYTKQIRTPKNIEMLQNFIIKYAVNDQADTIQEKIESLAIIQKEEQLLEMQFEETLRETQNFEQSNQYGFKQENKVIRFITSKIENMFDDFAARKRDFKEKQNYVSKKTSLLDLDTIAPANRKDLYQLLMRKRKLNFIDIEKLAILKMCEWQENLEQIYNIEENKTEVAAQDLFDLQKIFEELEQKEIKRIAELRSQKFSLYKTCLQIDSHPAYQFFIMLIIGVNTVFLALGTAKHYLGLPQVIEYVNIICFYVFLSEMVISMTARGFSLYFSNGFNIFDFIVIIVSAIDIILGFFNFSKSFGLQAVRTLRVFRLLRVVKLAKVWGSLNQLITLFYVTLQKIGYLTCIIFLFLVTYAILGQEFFAYKMSFDSEDHPVKDDFDFVKSEWKEGRPPDLNFDTFLNSFISVFIHISAVGWNSINQNILRMPGVSQTLAIFFFYSLYILGRLILYQLLLATLLREFDIHSMLQEVENKRTKGIKIFQLIGKGVNKQMLNKIAPIQLRTSDERRKDLGCRANLKKFFDADQSLFLFKTENKFRNFIVKVEDYSVRNIKVLDTMIWIAIMITSVLLAFENPLIDSKSKMKVSLYWIDVVLTCLFTIEVIIRVISKGFVVNGPKSYLRSASNVLDFFVVVLSLISVFFSNGKLGFVKILRIARLARPMRLIFRNENLKISLKVLGKALPQIARLFMIFCLICAVFGTIGINLLKGKLYHCSFDHLVGVSFNQKEKLILNEKQCINMGGEWSKFNSNFDNIQNSFIQMFMMSQSVGWETLMIQVMKSRDVLQAPLLHAPYESSVNFSIFFMMWIIFGNFFLQNLFVGVLIAAYNRQCEKQGSSLLLTAEQRLKIENKLLSFKIQPLKQLRKPKNRCRAFAFTIIHGEEDKKVKSFNSAKPTVKDTEEKDKESTIFEYFILMVIVLNTIVLVLKWPNMNPRVEKAVDLVNYICTSVFILEACLKLIAVGKVYFEDGWNIFDFIIVIGSVIFISPTFNKQKKLVTMIRAFRISRVFKLFNKFKQLQSIFQTIQHTMFSMINVGMLMLLILYLFAIVGVQLFGSIKLNGPMNDLYNFQTLPKAFLTLYRVLTRDHWNELMDAISLESSIGNYCIQNPTYQDYIDNGFQAIGCGKREIAVIYFFLFSFLISIVFLSLFIAIVMSGYFATNEQGKRSEMIKIIKKFRRVWSNFDPDGTGMISQEDFIQLMFRLGKPIGWEKIYKYDVTLLNFFLSRLGNNMPLHKLDPEGKWYINEVLDQLMFLMLVKKEFWKELHAKNFKIDKQMTVVAGARRADASHSESMIDADNFSRSVSAISQQ